MSNDIQASFRFAPNGLITEHIDRFDLWKWSRQALGPVGLVAGWTPFLQAKIRHQASDQLHAFLADEN